MSEAFDALLVQLKEKYDVIVLDTPPVGLVTDGVVVMRKVDIPIYIVRADYTKRAFAQVVNRLAANKHFNKLSIVLNGVGKRNSYGAYGGYGYYYGDRHYGYYQNERPVGFLGRLRQRIKQRFNPE
jgi:Mrp family chromosome partitioning ATPase